MGSCSFRKLPASPPSALMERTCMSQVTPEQNPNLQKAQCPPAPQPTRPLQAFGIRHAGRSGRWQQSSCESLTFASLGQCWGHIEMKSKTPAGFDGPKCHPWVYQACLSRARGSLILDIGWSWGVSALRRLQDGVIWL